MASNGEAGGKTPTVPPLLLPEILGFVPQLLLDDIINIANNAVQDGVNGMEEFLEKWTEQQAQSKGNDWDSTQEVEQGLVAFQTLLEHHTDLAFDFFEAWSLRNIFAIPPDLPIVLPHHQGLDLTLSGQRETELMEEMQELRKQIENQRKLQRMYTRALTASAKQRKRAENCLSQLSYLESPSTTTLTGLPNKVTDMLKTVAMLPSLDPASVNQKPLVDPGKRQWETSKSGYQNWAVDRLLTKNSTTGGAGKSEVDTVVAKVEEIGGTERLQAAIAATHEGRSDDNSPTQ